MAASDAELLEVIAGPSGDRARAWAELVERHTARLYAVARSFRLDEATAADLVQVAWLRLLERTAQLRDAESVGAWLCAIVRNEALRSLSRRRAVRVDDRWERFTDDRAPSHEDRLVADERRRALRTAFARLGPDCQQLLALLAADPPIPYPQVAAALGRPVGAIGPTRRRCLDQLRRHLPPWLEP